MSEQKQEEASVALVAVPTSGVVDLTRPGAIDGELARMAAMLEFKQKALALLVKRAKPTDITSQKGDKGQDHPWFSEAFLEQAAALMGGYTMQITSKDFEQYDGGHFGYCVQVRVELRGIGVSDGIGLATSRDQFLGSVEKKVWSDEERKKVPLLDDNDQPVLTREVSEVSRHNLLQHARSRAVGKALRNILGIAGMTWAELETMGYHKDGSATVDYAKNTRGSTPKSRVAGHVSSKKFTWADVGTLQKSLGLGTGKALDLDDAGLTKLADALDAQAKGEQS
jgi:hypothetical protein